MQPSVTDAAVPWQDSPRKPGLYPPSDSGQSGESTLSSFPRYRRAFAIAGPGLNEALPALCLSPRPPARQQRQQIGIGLLVRYRAFLMTPSLDTPNLRLRTAAPGRSRSRESVSSRTAEIRRRALCILTCPINSHPPSSRARRASRRLSVGVTDKDEGGPVSGVGERPGLPGVCLRVRRRRRHLQRGLVLAAAHTVRDRPQPLRRFR